MIFQRCIYTVETLKRPDLGKKIPLPVQHSFQGVSTLRLYILVYSLVVWEVIFQLLTSVLSPEVADVAPLMRAQPFWVPLVRAKGRPLPSRVSVTILWMLRDPLTSRFHSLEQFLQLRSPWRVIIVSFFHGFGLLHFRNVSHSPLQAKHVQLVRNSSTRMTVYPAFRKIVLNPFPITGSLYLRCLNCS